MNKLIKEYIDKHCEADKVAEAGDYENSLKDYIMKMAKGYLKGKNGYVEDSTVFNWVFDFFHDEEYKKETELEHDKLDEEHIGKQASQVTSHKSYQKEEKKKEQSYEKLSLFDL